jgi:hypothetical protein
MISTCAEVAVKLNSRWPSGYQWVSLQSVPSSALASPSEHLLLGVISDYFTGIEEDIEAGSGLVKKAKHESRNELNGQCNVACLNARTKRDEQRITRSYFPTQPAMCLAGMLLRNG